MPAACLMALFVFHSRIAKTTGAPPPPELCTGVAAGSFKVGRPLKFCSENPALIKRVDIRRPGVNGL